MLPCIEKTKGLAAQTIEERLVGLRRFPEAVRFFDPKIAHERMEEWKSISGLGNQKNFDLLLKMLKCSEDELLHVFGIPPQHLFKEDFVPDWLKDVMTAEDAGTTEGTSPSGEQIKQGLLAPFVPLLDHFLNQFAAFLEESAVCKELQGNPIFWEHFSSTLCDRFWFVSRRVLALEINIERTLGNLAGNTSEARCRNFILKMQEASSRRELLLKYPVLSRNLHRTGVFALEATKEFITRFLQDQQRIRKLFSIAPDDAVKALSSGAGDSHDHGRTVSSILFNSGKKVIYKPRSIVNEIRFQELIQWTNDLGLEFPLQSIKSLGRVIN